MSFEFRIKVSVLERFIFKTFEKCMHLFPFFISGIKKILATGRLKWLTDEERVIKPLRKYVSHNYFTDSVSKK